MSEKSRMRAKQREEKQQKQADRIIKGICIGLIVITLVVMVLYSLAA